MCRCYRSGAMTSHKLRDQNQHIGALHVSLLP